MSSDAKITMRSLLPILAALGPALAPAQTSIFLEEFHGGAYVNDGWVTWHAPWGSFPTVDLSADAASLSIDSRNGSCGIAILVDVSAFMGEEITLAGEWGGTATGGDAWVEVMFYQTESDDMTDLSSANFAAFDLGSPADIAIKHDSFGLPAPVWGPETFAADAVNNGVTAGFGGLTQTVSMPYVVIAFKVGQYGTISGLDNIHLTSPASPDAEVVVLDALDFNGGAFEITASGMNSNKTYILRRTTDGETFTDIGEPFTGGSSKIFVDPDPPAGAAPALYQVWEAAP